VCVSAPLTSTLLTRRRFVPIGVGFLFLGGRTGSRLTLGERFLDKRALALYGAAHLHQLWSLRRCNAPSLREGRARPGLVARAYLDERRNQIIEGFTFCW